MSDLATVAGLLGRLSAEVAYARIDMRRLIALSCMAEAKLDAVKAEMQAFRLSTS